MVIVYLFASLVGALTTIVVLSPYSWLIALLCAPLGGSALTVAAAVGVYVVGIEDGTLRPAAVDKADIVESRRNEPRAA